MASFTLIQTGDVDVGSVRARPCALQQHRRRVHGLDYKDRRYTEPRMNVEAGVLEGLEL